MMMSFRRRAISLVLRRVDMILVLMQTVHLLFQHSHNANTKVICPAFALTLAVNSICDLAICVLRHD